MLLSFLVCSWRLLLPVLFRTPAISRVVSAQVREFPVAAARPSWAVVYQSFPPVRVDGLAVLVGGVIRVLVHCHFLVTPGCLSLEQMVLICSARAESLMGFKIFVAGIILRL